jgi:polar amino acid transport system substrate-binding protein
VPDASDPTEWLVATKAIEPMVFLDGHGPRGFSIDLWHEVARRLDQPFQWLTVKTVTDQIDAVSKGQADIAIAAISMTPGREEILDFSYAYMDAGLQIMAPAAQPLSFWRNLRYFLGPNLLRLVGGLILFLLVIAHLVWIFNRFSPAKHYAKNYFVGVGEAFWWAAVTLSAGGYGDEGPPEGPLRRIAVLAWMFTGIVFISNFTAAITTQSTLAGLRNEISGVNDLPGKAIATVKGSTADLYLTQKGLRHTNFEKVEEAYPLLESGETDVIVYDFPVLQYYATNKGKGKVRLVGDVFNPEFYGIAMAENSPHREAINRALLAIKLDGTYETIYSRWFNLKS